MKYSKKEIRKNDSVPLGGYRLRRLENRPASGDPQQIVKILLDNKFNMLTASATSGWGLPFYESKVRPMDKRCTDPNFIPTLIRLCHENDIEIWSWVPFNIQDIGKDFRDWPISKLYPEYTMKFINPSKGEPDAAAMCTLSSPYIEEHARFLREIASLGFDGFWFDGAKTLAEPYGPNRIGCVCEYCRKAFREDTGLDLPTSIDWNDRRFKEWVRWRYRRMVRTADYFADELRSVNPKARVVMGTYWFPAGPGVWDRDWRRGWPLEYFSKFGTHAHGMPYEAAHGVGLHARIARAGNPEYTDIWTPIFALPPKNHYPSVPPHTMHMKLHGLCSVMNGAVPWYGGDGKGMKEVNEALAQAEPYFGGDELKYVAVVVSDLTRDFWASNTRADLYSGTLYGLYSILTQHQIQHGFIFNCHLEKGNLKDYSVIVLPNTACLSDQACAKVKEWVRGGGLLISYYETSLYNEWGEKRDNFGLADLFGVDYLGSSPISREIMRPTNLRAGDLNAGGQRFAFCSPHTMIQAVADDAEVLAATDPASSDGKEEPVLVRRAFGDGEVVYCTDDIGLGYLWWPYASTRRILSSLISRRPAPYTVTAPTVVMANAFKKGDRLLVHLLNYPYATNRMVGKGLQPVVDEPVPVHDIGISVNAFKVKSARTAISKKELKVSQSEGRYTTQLPPLELYEIAEFDLS